MKKAILGGARGNSWARGFTLIELALALAVGLTLTAVAIPIVNSSLSSFRLRGATTTVVWAIQSNRYRTIMQGYPYQMALSAANFNYQISSQPPGAPGFANVGNAIPFTSSPVVLNQDTTLQFRANGSVIATKGAMTMTLTYGGATKTITVSSNGDISVTP